MYKFVKDGGRFSWTNNMDERISRKYIVEFSKPSIQAYEEPMIMKGIDDILYFYYDMKIWDASKRKKKLVARVSTSDFPSIIVLKNILDEAINDDVTTNCQIAELHMELMLYQKHWDTFGYMMEDSYSLTKTAIRDKDGNKEGKYSYSFYAGCSSIDTSESKGCVFASLSDDEIIELKQCVDSFIQYAIDKENKASARVIDNQRANKECVDGLLVTYHDKSKESIDEIFVPDGLLSSYSHSKVSISLFPGNGHNEAQEFREIRRNLDGSILSVGDGVELKLAHSDEVVSIPLSDICFVTDTLDDGLISLNREEIADDFYNIICLSPTMMKMFVELDEKALFDIFASAIENRSWMYHDCHGFKREEVPSIIKGVISNLKRRMA